MRSFAPPIVFCMLSFYIRVVFAAGLRRDAVEFDHASELVVVVFSEFELLRSLIPYTS
jgi:hypothetical protein